MLKINLLVINNVAVSLYDITRLLLGGLFHCRLHTHKLKTLPKLTVDLLVDLAA